METLVVAHHRNHQQYYERNYAHGGSTKYGSIGSALSSSFRGINCRTFQSDSGLLPTPSKSTATPVSRGKSFSTTPKTPSPSLNESRKNSNKTLRSITTPIPIKIKIDNEGEFHFSELWAGPAYSNSPPPSSLPMPKFSLRPKRSVSLDLPHSTSETDLHFISKSAPASPTRGRSPSPGDLFDSADSAPGNMFDSADSATKTLRRILNLDITDE